MEFEVSYSLDNEQQFWDELDEIVSVDCHTREAIDNSLQNYLRFTSNHREKYLHSDYDVARCSFKLLNSALFLGNKEHVRRRITRCFIKESSADILLLVTSFLLFDGRENEGTFEIMQTAGAFGRLLELLQSMREDHLGLHRMLLELFYEMSRIQRLEAEDLRLVDDKFITYLFEIIEELSNDVDDPYHYPVIRVLLVLNEQYMVSSNESAADGSGPLTNKVIKILSFHGSAYKTFGENIILLLNRESETSLQLLILKLLYLLFTNLATYEYFYTNDLRVLVDVMIRNLLDLPDEARALRHTYLRVMYPLLAHTQLQHAPHYKRDEIIKLLNSLSNNRSMHFQPVDETTIRLVRRCGKVSWIAEPEIPENPARRHLGMSNKSAAESNLSVLEIAGMKERPGVLTPSRREMEGPFGNNSTGADAEETANGVHVAAA